MRKIILNILSIASVSCFAQTVEIGSDIFSDGGASQKDMIVTNSGELFIAMSNGSSGDKIQVLKYDGASWVNTMGTGNYVDSMCGNMKLLYNQKNDSIFLGYLKSDGFYLRSFDGVSWSSAEYYNGPVTGSGANDNSMLSAINEDSNIPYFMYEADNGVALTMVSFDYNLTSFVEYSVPDKGLSGLYASDLMFNQFDGFIYYSRNSVSGSAVIERYNGIGWSDLDENINALSDYPIEYSRIFQVENQNELICMYSYDTGGSSNNDRYGITKYDCQDNSKSYLLSETVVSGGVLRAAAYKNGFFYSDFSLFGYSGNENEVVWEQELSIDLRKDFCFDDQGYLYWNKNIGPSEYVYRSGPFVLGEKELDLEELTTIYPNPATSTINFRNKNISSVTIYALDGTLIQERNKVTSGEVFEVDFLNSGMYIFVLEDIEGNMEQSRVVIE